LIVGSLGALYQIRIKRLMAYSSIAHVGFILLSLVSSSFQVVSYSLNYLIIYVLLSQLFFFPLLILFSFFNNTNILYINELGSFLKKNPILAIIFMLNFFSMVGVPPLSGFFSKFFILLGLIQYNYYYIALIILLFSVLTAVYYLRLVQSSMFTMKKLSGFFLVIDFSYGYVLSYIFFVTVF
jgi:NADH:ubiquinone oxidoreductase subunit 2 (subunit N)